MSMQFTVEESNLICVFEGESREDKIREISAALQRLDDEDMKELSQTVLQKLQGMTDEEFAEVQLEAAD